MFSVFSFDVVDVDIVICGFSDVYPELSCEVLAEVLIDVLLSELIVSELWELLLNKFFVFVVYSTVVKPSVSVWEVWTLLLSDDVVFPTDGLGAVTVKCLWWSSVFVSDVISIDVEEWSSRETLVVVATSFLVDFVILVVAFVNAVVLLVTMLELLNSLSVFDGSVTVVVLAVFPEVVVLLSISLWVVIVVVEVTLTDVVVVGSSGVSSDLPVKR